MSRSESSVSESSPPEKSAPEKSARGSPTNQSPRTGDPTSAPDVPVPAFDRTELLPAVVQDARSGQVLMLGYMNRESYARTLDEGVAWFYSRSRQRLWKKGETSGNILRVRSVKLDCDGDTILVLADPVGPTCHTNAPSCFFTTPRSAGAASPFSAGNSAGSSNRFSSLFSGLSAHVRSSVSLWK